MNKKIMLLALAAISAVVLALPAIAAAEDEPLHVTPTPSGPQLIHGGTGTLSTSGSTIHCTSVGGELEFDSGGTTGEMELLFHGCTTFGGLVKCKSTAPAQPEGTIETTRLPFHLLTLPNNKPGVLVTPNPTAPASFAHINCAGVNFTVTGNGVIGTIEQPCGTISNEVDIDFNATGIGQQEHKHVAGTTTTYDLTKGTETAAEDATGTVTLTETVELECT